MSVVFSLEAIVGSSVLGEVTDTAHCKTLADTLTVPPAQPKQQVGLHGAFETDCTEKNIWNSQTRQRNFPQVYFVPSIVKSITSMRKK